MRLLPALACLVLGGPWVGCARGDKPDARQIVVQADLACKAVRMISYRAEAWGEGALRDQLARFRATVSAKEGAEGAPPLLRFEGTAKGPGGADERSFHMVVDGKRAISLDNENKICTVGEIPEGIDLFAEPLQLLYLHHLLHPTPFQDVFTAGSPTYEGRKTAGGTTCHVVHVIYGGGQAEARWYFAVDDYLPRRLERVLETERGKGTLILELRDIDTAPAFDNSTFATTVPAGYEAKQYERPLRNDPALLPVGSPAPDWTLKTPGGKVVTLSALRGKVVVLDFWATWCVPCLRAMPSIQKLHTHFKDKPVMVFGINAREMSRAADPVGYMKRNGFTYGLLLNGDAVGNAYRVMALPTFYVVGPDGKIVHAAAGFNPANEGALTRFIESLLKDSE